MSVSVIRELVDRLGGQLCNGGASALIPGPGHSRRDRSLSVTIGDNRALVFYSFSGDSFEQVQDYLGLAGFDVSRPRLAASSKPLAPSAKDRHRANHFKTDWCGHVWSHTEPAEGTPTEAYLLGVRGITTPLPLMVRHCSYAPMDYEGRFKAPAVVCAVQNRNGNAIGLHITAIKADGAGKASDDSRRMFGIVTGGAIQLHPFTEQLAVAEGLETALSFNQLTGIPTWSCLSSSGLAGFDIPPNIKLLTIAADGDQAGLEAAIRLSKRAREVCDVKLNPAPEGCDWNDILKAQAHG